MLKKGKKEWVESKHIVHQNKIHGKAKHTETSRRPQCHRIQAGVLTHCAHSYLFICLDLAVGLQIFCKSSYVDSYFLLFVDSNFVPHLTFLPPLKVINIFGDNMLSWLYLHSDLNPFAPLCFWHCAWIVKQGTATIFGLKPVVFCWFLQLKFWTNCL